MKGIQRALAGELPLLQPEVVDAAEVGIDLVELVSQDPAAASAWVGHCELCELCGKREKEGWESQANTQEM